MKTRGDWWHELDVCETVGECLEVVLAAQADALEAAAKLCDQEVDRDGYMLPAADRIQQRIRDLKP